MLSTTAHVTRATLAVDGQEIPTNCRLASSRVAVEALQLLKGTFDGAGLGGKRNVMSKVSISKVL